jgi:hypothetical protein
MTVAAQQATGFTNAWLWGKPELSDVTLLLATMGGCGLGLLPCCCCCCCCLFLECYMQDWGVLCWVCCDS